jgi:lauroyl/myristoyl acyltransferase/acyl carrier protein
VNRLDLPDPPERARSELEVPFIAPETEAEKELAKIISEILDLDRVGVNDNFFDLGGESISVMRLFAQIEMDFGKRLPPTTIVEAPTIGELAKRMDEDASVSYERAPLPKSSGKVFVQKRFELTDLYWAFVWLIRKRFYSTVPIPLLFLFARLKGFFLSSFSQERFVVERNLSSVFGHVKSEKEIHLIARRHFEFLGKLEFIRRLAHIKGFSPPERWPVEGLHHLDSALSEGKGVIVVFTHFGYTNLIRYFLRMRGYKPWGVEARTSKRGKMERKRLRDYTAFRKFMYSWVHVERDGRDATEETGLVAALDVRPLVEILGRNGILVTAGDAQHAVKFVNLSFLGDLYPFPTGFMSIAMHTGSPVLPIFVVDSEDGLGIKAIIEKPLTLDQNGTPNQDLTTNMERFAQVFESHVNRYPHLFKIWAKENWFEKRRTRSRRELAKRY